jgi:hypothetical protein
MSTLFVLARQTNDDDDDDQCATISLMCSCSSLNHFILSTTNANDIVYALVVREQSSQIEIHQVKSTFTTHSDSFMDKFKLILKDMLMKNN